MVTERIVAPEARRELDKQDSAELYLMFITLTHPSLPEPIRVVSDPENFVLDGDLYQGFDFELAILNDSEQPPRAQLTVQNVDRIIGQAVFAADDPVRVEIQVIAGSQFDLTVSPRVASREAIVDMFNGENGALYDIQPGLVFQDNAMTIPAVADGDPVRAIMDMSGNGNHARLATATPPFLRTNGKQWWINHPTLSYQHRANWAGGVGPVQNMILASIEWATPPISVASSLMTSYTPGNPGAGGMLYINTTPNLFYLIRRLNAQPNVMSTVPVIPGNKYVMEGGFSSTGVDGVFGMTVRSNDTGNFAAETTYTAATFVDVCQSFYGKFYGGIAFFRYLVTADKLAARAWLRQRAGIAGVSSVERMYRAKFLYLTEVEGTVFTVSGVLRSWDYTQETWPGIRATSARMPGLYW